MKKNIMIVCFLIVSSILGSPALADTHNDTNHLIIPEKVTYSNESFICSFYLDGEMENGDQVIAEHCDADGTVKWSNILPAEEKMEITVSDADFSDCLQILWSDDEDEKRCESAIMPFNVFYTGDWMDLADVTVKMIDRYKEKIEIVTDDFKYASGRLIVKADGNLPDLSDFNPDMVVIDDEDHYYLQFVKDEDAIRCEEYLNTLANVEYVEPVVKDSATNN